MRLNLWALVDVSPVDGGHGLRIRCEVSCDGKVHQYQAVQLIGDLQEELIVGWAGSQLQRMLGNVGVALFEADLKKDIRAAYERARGERERGGQAGCCGG